MDIHVEVTGARRPVVLLHGFPDSGRLWQSQVAALSAAGFMVIVPDLRDHGGSAKPASVEEYSFLFVAGDVLAMLDHLRLDIDHLVALSVGHPAAFRAAGIEQLEKSWYMFFFQFEGVAERWLSDDSWANLRAWTKHPDIDDAIAELGENGSLTPALNWYRANFPPHGWVDAPVELPPIQAPTMGVWSTGDFALTERQMTGSAEHVAGPWRYERLDGPGHWMQREAPDEVNRLLLDFLPD